MKMTVSIKHLMLHLHTCYKLDYLPSDVWKVTLHYQHTETYPWNFMTKVTTLFKLVTPIPTFLPIHCNIWSFFLHQKRILRWRVGLQNMSFLAVWKGKKKEKEQTPKFSYQELSRALLRTSISLFSLCLFPKECTLSPSRIITLMYIKCLEREQGQRTKKNLLKVYLL